MKRKKITFVAFCIGPILLLKFLKKCNVYFFIKHLKGIMYKKYIQAENYFLTLLKCLLKNVSQQKKTRKISENKAPEQRNHRYMRASKLPLAEVMPLWRCFTYIVLPFSKQGPETKKDPLTHRNICNCRLSLSIPLVEPSFFL